MSTSLKVAVIGAGVSGLTVARELQRESHQVVIFEKSNRLGGTWVYDPRVESDLLGVDPKREIIHGSIYNSLLTNSPRPLMCFDDFSMSDKFYGDDRLFPGHEEVLKFLEDFAHTFQLNKLIRFNTLVTRVELVDPDSEIIEFEVESTIDRLNTQVELFDAVVICNGHNTEPRLPTDIPGIETWPSKKQMHSHNYRVPEPFRDQIVVVIGSGPTGSDLSREIAKVAKEVHISARTLHAKVSKMDKFSNIWQHAKIRCINEDGTLTFEDGLTIYADMIVHCTGYKCHVPFLQTNGIVNVEDKCVGPLYKHVFVPKLAPRLSFVGLTEKSIVFASIESQSKWVAKALSMKVSLPSVDEMLSDVEEYYRYIKEKGVAAHSLEFQTDYIDWVAAQCGMDVDKKHSEMFKYIISCFMSGNFDGFRNAFEEKYG